MKIGFVSLGCPKNLCDSETMLGLMEARQLEITTDPAEAEIIFVNTCGFIQAAKEESINKILEMAAYKKTGSCRYLIVTGCLVQRYAQELWAQMPEVDALVGTAVYEDISQVLDRVLQGERVFYLERPKTGAAVPKNLAQLPRKLTTPGYYAYLKIAEGCDNKCSYCAIPMIRGPYVSRPYDEIMAEARRLVAGGVKELILVAQDTSRYGSDLYGSCKLASLLKDLNGLPGLKWIRVLYLYPNNFNDELIEAFVSLPKVCKYVDLPLQHASDRLLQAMNRFDKRADVEKLLAKLRARIPGIVLRTTFIVGFPGETEDDFAQLKDFVRQERFENAGVFTYSREENTAAAKLPDQIPEKIKEARYQELMALQAGIAEDIHRNLEGKNLEVVVESLDAEHPDLAKGRSYHEAPDIDGTIYIEEAAGLRPGDFITVQIQQGFTYEMMGRPVLNK